MSRMKAYRGEMNDKSTIERAFELARSGRCNNTSDIRKTLREERFDLKQLEGPTLAKQLRAAIRAAHPTLRGLSQVGL